MTQGNLQKRAILILGMHRSGTSALTRVVNLLGANVGNDLLPAAADNPSGFWEHSGVVSVHENLLNALNRSWHDLRAMPAGWLESEAAQLARRQLTEVLTAEFSEAALWAVKDPRLCRLLPLWKQVLGDLDVDAHAVFVLRHPDEVAASLLARNGIAVEYTRLSWLQHTVEAEIGSRGLSRSVISYDNLLQDWSSCVKRLSDDMKLEWPVPLAAASGEIGTFLNSGARHHEAKNASRRLPELIAQVYNAFSAKASLYDQDWHAVEAATKTYLATADTFLDATDAIMARLSAAESQLVGKNAEIVSLKATLDGLFRSIEENDSREYLHHGLTSSGLLKDCAKIYYRRANEAYAEARSVSFDHDGMRQSTRLHFELPAGCVADFIRFDPSEFPGEFLISECQIGAVSILDFDSSLCANSSHIVSSAAGELRIASVGADPNIELDVAKLGVPIDGVIAVDLSCRRITPYGELRDLIESLLSAGRIEATETLTLLFEHHAKASLGRMDILAGQLSSSEQRHQETDSSLQNFASQLAKVSDACNENLEYFRKIEAKQLEYEKTLLESNTKLASLQQQQQRTDQTLDTLSASLGEFSRACTESFARLRESEEQHVLDTAELKLQLSEIRMQQRRSFLDVFTRKKLRN